MTCAEAQHFVLSADLADLRGAGNPELRAHLTACAACAAAARQILSSTDLLRQALIARGARPVSVQRPRRSRAQRVLLTQVPLLMAAGIAAVAFVNQRETSALPEIAPRLWEDTSTMSVTAAGVEPVAVQPAKRAPVRRAVPVVTKQDSTSPRDDSAGVRRPHAGDDSSWYSPVTAALQVMPTSRSQRVAVIATSNPKITVVWLTKGDSL